MSENFLPASKKRKQSFTDCHVFRFQKKCTDRSYTLAINALGIHNCTWADLLKVEILFGLKDI